jgi:carboxymethylenebutenolidase
VNPAPGLSLVGQNPAMQITLPSTTPAELARPADGRAPTQGLVLLPDIGGLRPLFADHAQRIADEQGWAVCAIEPWPGREHLTLDDRLAEVGTLSDSRLLGDAAAAADACEVDTVGVLGFCMGGMYALKAAGTGRFDRAVAFYGMIHVPERWQGDDQADPLASATSPGACPALAIIGTADVWTPQAEVDELEDAGVTVVRYDGADHGFAHDPSRPTHRPADAADAWSRALAFLAT